MTCRLAKVNAAAGSEVNTDFKYTRTSAFHAGYIAHLNPRKRRFHLHRSLDVQLVEPTTEGPEPLDVLVFVNGDHAR